MHCIVWIAASLPTILLERLPEPSQVGKTKVGGVDYNQLRMRVAMRASLALATAPKGFTASDLACKVGDLNPVGSIRSYTPRQAAYDLKKLRGKQFVEKIGSSHRYRRSSEGLRAMTALVVLRDKFIKPLLASCCPRKRGRKPKNATPSTRTTNNFKSTCSNCSRTRVSPPHNGSPRRSTMFFQFCTKRLIEGRETNRQPGMDREHSEGASAGAIMLLHS